MDSEKKSSVFFFPAIRVKLMALFLDFIGFSVLVSFLPFFFASSYFADYSQKQRYVLFALFLAVFAFFQALGNYVFSQKLNRSSSRFFLLLSYSGNAVGYFLCMCAIFIHQPYLLFLANAYAGFVGTNLSGTQTAIAHLTEKNTTFRGFNLSSMSIGCAFLIGPFLFSYLLPFLEAGQIGYEHIFLFCSVCSLSSFLLVKSKISWEQQKLSSTHQLWVFPKRHGGIFLSAFFFSLGWSIFIKFFQLHLLETHHFSKAIVSQVITFFGVGVLSCQVFLMQVKRHLATLKITFFALLVLTFLLGGFSLVHSYALFSFFMVCASFFYAFIQSSLPFVVAEHFFPQAKGRGLALFQSAHSLGKVFAPLLGIFLFSFTNVSPFFLGVITLGCSAFCFWFSCQSFFHSLHKKKKAQ